MISRSDQAVLQLMHTPKVGARTLDRVLTAAREEGTDLEDVLSLGPGDLSRLGVREMSSESLRAGREEAERLAELLEQHEIRLLVKGRDEYPAPLASRLGDAAPPVLFARGRLEILRRNGVAFCGSRRASEKGLLIARACADALAGRGVNIVSGYANGVDLTAHSAALSAGGVTTLVLAEGILRFKPKGEVVSLLSEDNHLILSQFPPRMRWTAGNAMQRNAVVLGLAHAVLVIESGLEGGTFAAGEEAIRRNRPLFVVDYADPPPSAEGNPVLIQHGGITLRMRADGSPNLADLLKALEGAGPNVRTRSNRMAPPTLFDALEDAG